MSNHFSQVFRLFVLTVFFSIAPLNKGFSQRFGFRQYNVEQGLTHSQVRSIHQDQSGYLWIGTLGGLSKFDGREFSSFGKSKGFHFDQIESITQLFDGRMAVGSTGEFALLTEESTQVFSLGQKNSGNAIQKIVQASDSSIWLATQSGVFNFFPGDEPLGWREEFFGKIDVRGIISSENSIVILTTNALLKITQEKIDTLYYSPEAELNDVLKDQSDNYWLASNGAGLIRINSEIKQWTADDGLISNRILKICIDQFGTVWCGSRLGFSKVTAQEEISSYNQNNGLPYAEIRELIVDSEDNIWLGTDGGGLIRFLGESFTQFTSAEGLPSNLVMTMTKDANDNLWIGTYDRGVYKLTPPEKNISWKDGLANDKVWASFCDNRGRLWFGTSGGISIVEGSKITSISNEQGLPANKILCFFQNAEHQIWVGTSSGVCIISEDLQRIEILPSIPTTKIRSIIQAENGAMWFATSSGVYSLNDQKLNHFSIEEGLSDESCSSLCFDEQKRLWVGTKNGLHLFNGGKFELISLDDDYSSNFINFLLSLHEGVLVGTNNGLFLVSKDENETRLFNYSLEDGIGSLETNINAVYKDSGSAVWFGTTAGLVLHEGKFGNRWKDVGKPKISLNQIRLNLNITDWKKKKVNVDSLTGLPINLELPFNQNHLTFYFTGISTNYPEDIRYRYMLEDFDEDWQPLTNINFATYTNIPDGDFQFKVQCLSKEGKWSEELSFPFTINPPFWATWWFVSLSVIAVIGLILLFIHRRKQRLIEALEKEKLEMKSKMLGLEQQSLNSSMNRHFIFNALNSIQYYINRQDRLAANKYLSSFAKLIRKNLDSSQQTFTSLNEELERLELYLQLEKMRFQDKFEYRIDIDENIDVESVQVPAMLLQPFLENSIWHGILPKGEMGTVTLDIKSDGNGQVIFTISDDGIGFKTSQLNKADDGNHISKGMDISGGRLELITRLTGKRAFMTGPEEILSSNGEVKGTFVKISIPTHWN